MPIQPSFRSKSKHTKAASMSRGSDRGQGSFLDSMKEVLDDVTSVPPKIATTVEPQVKEVIPHLEPPVEADPQAARDLPDADLPRLKRSRTDQVEYVSRSSSSSRGGTVGWNFTHARPGSILEDTNGMATLMRHMKRSGCSLPSINNLVNKEEYAEIAYHLGQLAGAINKAQFGFENAMRNAPDATELAQVSELVKATKAELNEARAEVKRLGSKADAQQGKIESLLLELKVKGRRLCESEAARKVAEQHVQELISSSQDHQKTKEAEVRQAVRAGKKEVADAYHKILTTVKEKFVKKKNEEDLKVYAQEIQANTDLLNDLLKNEIESAEKEYDRLKALLPAAVAAYEKAQVSDFSVSKLPHPQLSESSGTFEINLFNPSFSGEYGSNLDSMGLYPAPVDDAPGATDQDVGEVPSTEEPAKDEAVADQEMKDQEG